MKRSILFGVLAMFAVSALSVQNLNAQNVKPADKPAVNPTQAINGPKDKPKDPSAIKGSNEKVVVNPTAKDEPAETAMRAAQNPKGQKDLKTDKPKQPSKPKIVKDKKMKNDAKADQKKEGQKKQGKEGVFEKKDHKTSKPKIVKDKKMKNDGKANEQKVDQNNQGKEQKPAIVKPGKNDKIENNAQGKEQKVDQNAEGKDQKPAIVKPGANGKIENNSQAVEVKDDQKKEGNYNANNKNDNPNLKKDESQDPINNVVRPKEKVGEGTGTQNNNGTK